MSFPATPTNGQYYPSETTTDANGMRWQASVAGTTVRWLKKPLIVALAVATASVLGGVMQGTGPISIAVDGKVNIDALSTSAANTAIAAASAVGAAAGVSASTANTAAAAAQAAADARIATFVREGNNILAKDAAGTTINTIALGDLGVDIAADNLAIDGNFVMTFTQTNGGGTKTVDLRTLKPISSSMSITGDGDGTPIKLAGDTSTPGNRKLYGTAADGSKGWQDGAMKVWTATPDGTALAGDEDHSVAGSIFKARANTAGGLEWLQVA